jgi:cytochrome c oxidase assembly protein subunit 15
MVRGTAIRESPPGAAAFGSSLNGACPFSGEPKAASPGWLHWWAVMTVCAAFPLLLLGAEVTTKGVGMVDPRGFRAPWHLLREIVDSGLWTLINERGLGYLIEHSHRLFGFVVGICIIVLALGLWLREPRRWVRWLGLAALLAVSAQGVLGIFRVNLNALMGGNLALVHGCFAQLVFALLVSLVVVTSRWWTQDRLDPCPKETARLRTWSLITAGLVYGQLVLGALVRHRDYVFGARVHVLTAFVVVAVVVWLVKEVLENPGRSRQETAAALVLAGLVVLQLVLGMEAWLSKFASPEALDKRALTPLAVHPDLMRSLHYVVGALVFSATVVVALQAHRRRSRLEGAA